jgi:hypothetical protein
MAQQGNNTTSETRDPLDLDYDSCSKASDTRMSFHRKENLFHKNAVLKFGKRLHGSRSRMKGLIARDDGWSGGRKQLIT